MKLLLKKGATILCLFAVLLTSCGHLGNEKPQIIGWGDSMMKGAGGEKSILEVMSDELGGLNYENYAVGGLKSKSIAVLQGGIPLKLKFDKEQLGFWDTATSVYHSDLLFNNQTEQYRRGTVNGNAGKLYRNSDTLNPAQTKSFTFKKGLTFQTLQLKDTVVFKFDDAIPQKDAITIIWAGRNDNKSGTYMYQTRDNIQAMMDHIGAEAQERTLIVSICNGIGDKEFKGSVPHTQIKKLNALLQDSFKEHFIDLRTYLVKDAMYDMGIKPTSQDLEDMAKDCIPRSFFFDHVHFNSLGYEAAGKYLAQVVKDKEWIN